MRCSAGIRAIFPGRKEVSSTLMQSYPYSRHAKLLGYMATQAGILPGNSATAPWWVDRFSSQLCRRF